MDDFKETVDKTSIYQLINEFEVEGKPDICYDCIHFDEDCIVRKVFKADYHDEIIAKCRGFR